MGFSYSKSSPGERFLGFEFGSAASLSEREKQEREKGDDSKPNPDLELDVTCSCPGKRNLLQGSTSVQYSHSQETIWPLPIHYVDYGASQGASYISESSGRTPPAEIRRYWQWFRLEKPPHLTCHGTAFSRA